MRMTLLSAGIASRTANLFSRASRLWDHTRGWLSQVDPGMMVDDFFGWHPALHPFLASQLRGAVAAAEGGAPPPPTLLPVLTLLSRLRCVVTLRHLIYLIY